MSKLESTITELERQLALKKGFQAVKFVLPKTTPTDVAEEIQAKLREIAEGLALSKEQLAPSEAAPGAFTSEQVDALKMLADTVLKKVNGAPAQAASAVPAQPYVPPTPKSYGSPRKAKIMTAENVRGEGKRFAAPDDEIYVPNPEKVDEHGMVSATHMKRGIMLKIPVEDIEFLD